MDKMRKNAARKLLKKPKGKFQAVDLEKMDQPSWMTRAYKNNRYVVMIDDKAEMTGCLVAIKAMVQRHDDKPIPFHWREMQAIKNELFGIDAVGIEYYPKERNLQDFHNIYWLWILPEGALPAPLL